MEPTYETTDAFDLFGLLWHGTDNREIPPLWGRFEEIFAPHFGTVPSERSYGACGPMDADGAFDYLMAMELGPQTTPGDGLTVWRIPAGRWAVFATPLGKIRDTFHAIHSDWLPTAGVARRDAPLLERYGPTFDGTPEAILEILVPVE